MSSHTSDSIANTAVCIATGPSLTEDDCRRVSEYSCVTVNDAYRLAPWADVHYAAGADWWRIHNEAVSQSKGLRLSVKTPHTPPDSHPEGVECWDVVRKPGLSRSMGILHHGLNSGYQAINVAYLLGARKIILLGYDMKGGPGAHFFGPHPEPLRGCTNYSKFIAGFRTINPPEYGVEIINCSRDTALDAFPVMSLEEALHAD